MVKGSSLIRTYIRLRALGKMERLRKMPSKESINRTLNTWEGLSQVLSRVPVLTLGITAVASTWENSAKV